MKVWINLKNYKINQKYKNQKYVINLGIANDWIKNFM